MRNLLKIIKYSIFDLLRSRWSYAYLMFYLLLGFSLLFLNNDLSKAIITLMNVIVVLTPLIGTLFGIMYFYNSREFTELLLAQPIKRSAIFLGQYAGVSISLSLSIVLGLGIPFLAYGIFQSAEVFHFLSLLLAGAFLSFIFVALAFIMGLFHENRIRGFGFAILIWLFFAILYDGLFLILLFSFQDYPLDRFALYATMFNPVDLSRIFILLKLDISALLGYTGAVFQQFFGTRMGSFISVGVLLFWIVWPSVVIYLYARRKDF